MKPSEALRQGRMEMPEYAGSRLFIIEDGKPVAGCALGAMAVAEKRAGTLIEEAVVRSGRDVDQYLADVDNGYDESEREAARPRLMHDWLDQELPATIWFEDAWGVKFEVEYPCGHNGPGWVDEVIAHLSDDHNDEGDEWSDPEGIARWLESLGY